MASTKWRVAVYLEGKAQFYNDYEIEGLANEYAERMRKICKSINSPAFVRKFKRKSHGTH